MAQENVEKLLNELADITAEPRWWDLFEKELMRQRMIERTNQAESDSIPVSQDYE